MSCRRTGCSVFLQSSYNCLHLLSSENYYGYSNSLELPRADKKIVKFENNMNTDNFIVQKHNNHSAHTTNDILKGLSDFPDTSTYLALGISLIFQYYISKKMIR